MGWPPPHLPHPLMQFPNPTDNTPILPLVMIKIDIVAYKLYPQPSSPEVLRCKEEFHRCKTA